MIKTTQQKTWESVFFTAEDELNGDKVTVEVELNHATGKWHICTEGQEHVSFDQDTINEGMLRVEALSQAVHYVKQQFKK